MCDNDFTVDFYRELTTIVCNISIFFKKEEKFCIFPLSHFLKKCKLISLRKVIKNVVTAKNFYNGF